MKNKPDSISSDNDDRKLRHRLTEIVKERGFFKGLVEVPKDRAPWWITFLLIVLAYLFSFTVRLEWIDFAQEQYLNEDGQLVYAREGMVKDGVALPNTHDSFYFGSILQKGHLGMHQNNNLVPSVLNNGMITVLPYLLLEIFPSLTIEYLLLWLPVYISGLVCIPIVLIGRLYGSSIWGFLAACLAGVTHSYYNRTLAGYYDTDMFSITIPAFALFALLAACRKESVSYVFAAALILYLYRFFYVSGQAITGALIGAFIAYRLILFLVDLGLNYRCSLAKAFLQKSSVFTFKAIILMSLAGYGESWSWGYLIEQNPYKFLLGIGMLVVSYLLLKLFKSESHHESEIRISRILDSNKRPLLLPFFCFATFCFSALSGDLKSQFLDKFERYVSAGEGVAMKSASKDKGYSLKYLDVFSTVREASEVPPKVVRNRILSDLPTCSCPRCLPANESQGAFLIPTALIGLLGLGLLVVRFWEFSLCLPFVAIAYLCFKGVVGLRFTVHVGNVASLGICFLVIIILWLTVRKIIESLPKKKISEEQSRFVTHVLAVLLVAFMVWPNVQHAKNYNSHVVYPDKTIEVLEALGEASNPDDFVVTWWDYGSGCWFYGNTRTFTSPAHQTFDNFLTSEILRSTSPVRAKNLSCLKTETYLRLQEEREAGSSLYTTAVQAIFKDGTPNLIHYQALLDDLTEPTFSSPPRTRDIFLFMPYEIMRIFPTILSFSSRNLYFDKNFYEKSYSSGEPPLTILRNGRREGSSIAFDGGYRIDRRGNLRFQGEKSGIINYGQLWSISNDSKPATIASALSIDGLEIATNGNSLSSRRLLFIKDRNDLVILSASTFHSTFAKRFLLDRFDSDAYSHPSFYKGALPIRQPYMAQADWVTSQGSKIILNMRGGYKIEGDLRNNLATVPGLKDQVPFAFHRNMHDAKTGKMVKLPVQGKKDAPFHLVQTNMPYFTSGTKYNIPEGGLKLSNIASQFGVPLGLLAKRTGLVSEDFIAAGENIEIPSKGYGLRQAWFFMDQEIFDSTLVKGFLREDLSNEIFEMIYSSPWGKVYKIIQ
jgi:dolichyl-diphosphooligosaccharide--protein glycosyltransferase/undecaprenyl-diphosphooligosaccharide--protein glycosyltransferase